MVAVAKKRESVRRSARTRLPDAARAGNPVAQIPVEAEQQLQELERTFTDRYEW